MEFHTDLRSRTWLEIDCKRIAENYKIIERLYPYKIWATLKANAYGFGGPVVAKVLSRQGCFGFNVACLEEAIAIREAVDNPIMLLGCTPVCDAKLLADYDVQASIPDCEYAEALNAEAQKLGITLNVHIQIDTGMTRLGIFAQGDRYEADAAEQICRICSMSNLNVVGLYTHFSAGEEPSFEGYSQWQRRSFQNIVNRVRTKTGCSFFLSSASSGSLLHFPEGNEICDSIRPGCVFYGLEPRQEPFDPDIGIRDAFSFRTRVAQVKTVPAGTFVSYGLTHRMDRPGKVAVLSVGYADGWLRNLQGCGMYATIKGQRCPQIGRITMDLSMYDATDCEIERGDEAVLFGYGGMPGNIFGQSSGMITVNVTGLITQRVPRIYINKDF